MCLPFGVSTSPAWPAASGWDRVDTTPGASLAQVNWLAGRLCRAGPSVATAYGVLVMVSQHGFAKDVLGFSS
jgi:hypothetical protein